MTEAHVAAWVVIGSEKVTTAKLWFDGRDVRPATTGCLVEVTVERADVGAMRSVPQSGTFV